MPELVATSRGDDDNFEHGRTRQRQRNSAALAANDHGAINLLRYALRTKY